MKPNKIVLLAIIVCVVLIGGIITVFALSPPNAEEPLKDITNDLDRNDGTSNRPDCLDLSKTSGLVAKSNTIAQNALCTKNGQINVSIEGEGCEGVFYLYDAQNDKDYIQSFELSPEKPSEKFTQLSSSATYYIVAKDIDANALIKVTEE